MIHTFTYGPSWWTITVGACTKEGYPTEAACEAAGASWYQLTSRDAIGKLVNKQPLPHRTVDDCAGLMCSKGC